MGDEVIGGGVGFAPFVVVGDDEVDVFFAEGFGFVDAVMPQSTETISFAPWSASWWEAWALRP